MLSAETFLQIETIKSTVGEHYDDLSGFVKPEVPSWPLNLPELNESLHFVWVEKSSCPNMQPTVGLRNLGCAYVNAERA